MTSTTSKFGHNSLIDSCLEVFQTTLASSFEKAVNNTLDDLFSQADNAASNQQEAKLFEQYHLLKKTSPKLLESVVVVTHSMPNEITQQISLGEGTIKLSLVEDEELEISLAFSQLEAALDIKFSKFLFALEKRLKILFSSKIISKTNMPFGIASVCWIFSRILDLSSSNIITKTSLLDNLRKILSVDLLETYKTIDKKFVRAGILPNIKIETKQATRKSLNKVSIPDESSSLSRAPAGVQQQERQPNSNSFDQDNQRTGKIHTKSSKLVNSIFDLMNNDKQHQELSKGASTIDNNTLDKTLDNLSKMTGVTAGSTEINKLKEMILDDVKNETGVYYPNLNTEQQNSLDLMGMFYDHVKEDSSIDSNMLTSLNSINIPLIRMAINDTEFFNSDNHPARQYLERIIYASQKWHGTSIVKNLNKFSSNIASDFDGSTKSFDLANEDLDSYLKLTERRAKNAEEKWVNAAKGKEKLEISRHKVEEVIDSVSKKAIPKFVKNVIKYVIQDALTLSLLRHGEDSDEWHKNVNTSKTIAKMANPKLIKGLTPKQKIESLHHLDQTMDELGFSENDRTKTLNNIKECAQAATKNDLGKNIQLEEVTTINENKKNVKKEAGSVKIEELRSLTPIEKTELTKIRLMPYGTLFDFIINQQRDKVRRKLSWFSPISNKALFVSLLGKRPYEKSLNAIAIDIARKNIIVVKVEKKKYFNTILSGIFSKLKGLTGAAANLSPTKDESN